LNAIFAKIGVAGISSDLATLIRTMVIDHLLLAPGLSRHRDHGEATRLPQLRGR